MQGPFGNLVYRKLFSGQVLSLFGSGLATVALGLLAYDLAGADAGVVLGMALFIKMIAYVGLAPIAGAFVDRFPRRTLLVGLDLFRACIALSLPFVTEIWQIYVLIFLLQAASAAFTPVFQATIPDILTDEGDYTRALSWSRMAYDLESLLSPVFAAVLLSLMDFHWLFAGTSLGFVLSAVFVATSGLQARRAAASRDGFMSRATKGLRIYLATPRLRGLFAFNVSAAACGAFVIVNTVVLVRDSLGGGDVDVALALAAFGGGSMVVALLLPRVLERVSDRFVMASGAVVLSVSLSAFAVVTMVAGPVWGALWVAWTLIGMGYSAVLTPVGRLLRRSSSEDDRASLFAAQFTLSHLAWLVTYPLAGWVGSALGLAPAMVILAGMAWAGFWFGLRMWPTHDPEIIGHTHEDLPADHPHLAGGKDHNHAFHIDALHRHWPKV